MAAVPDIGRLTTHVLDVARGVPARGMLVRLERLEASGTSRVREATTGQDGRVAEPLAHGRDLRVGAYELLFSVGAYFTAAGIESPFLDVVPVRFVVTDEDAHYHVPLLVTPWSYSTYRGS